MTRRLSEFLAEAKYRVRVGTEDGESDVHVDASNPVSARAAAFSRAWKSGKRKVRVLSHAEE